jgi:hypothetical protein
MALPSNVVGLMGIDNSGNVVTIPADAFTTSQATVTQAAAITAAPAARPTTTNIITNATTETVALEIDADENYLVKVNSTRDNFDNSILYQSSSNRIGLNTKSPQFAFDVNLNSINITNLKSNFGYKLNGGNFGYTIGDSSSLLYGNIYLGDAILQTIVVPYLVISKTEIKPTPAIIYKRPLYVDDTGLVDAYTAFTEGSIIFSSQTQLTQNNARLFWDNTNFRLGVLTNTPAYTLDVNGIARIQTSLITPIIGNTSGVAANNTWTFASNVNIPLVPVDASHAVSKQYVDNLVDDYALFTDGSIIFSSQAQLTQNNARLFWDNTNFRLGVSTNTPDYALDVNGVARIQTSLITPIIGNTLGIAANNTWTFSSNVNIPLIPVDASHAASKQYVDNTALTGLKLGAEVKTVATTNVGLSGLAAINGYTPVAGDRILVVGQSTQSANGIYEAASGGWTRATDSDTDAELRGYQYLITAGTFINARYGNTNQTTITVGSTAITYQTISAGESDPIFTASPSFAITNTNISNWNTSYNRSIVSSAFSGTATQTLTLTRQDGGTLTSSFTFPVTSVFGRTGVITLTSSDVTTALGYTPYNGATNPNGYISSISSGMVTSALGYTPYNGATNPNGYISSINSSNVTSALGYTPYNGATNINGYISSISSGMVTSALGYTPVPTTRVLTINGVAQDLSQNRSWTIAAGLTSFNGLTGAITYGYNEIIGSGGLNFLPANSATTLTINGTAHPLSANMAFTTVSTITTTSGNGISSVVTNPTNTPNIAIGATTDNIQVGSLKVGTFIVAPPNTSGNIYASGTITAAGDIIGYSTSDERLKDNITVIDNAIEKISKLRGVTFSWTENAEEMYGLTGDDMGLIAQDVQSVAPLAVQERESGYLAVRYEKIIGLLVAGMNEQESRIKELENKLK